MTDLTGKSRDHIQGTLRDKTRDELIDMIWSLVAASVPAFDSEPPIALDEFIEQSGLSAVTLWRYRRAGWLHTLNICGRHYLTRSEIARFNARAASGEFAKRPARPKRRDERLNGVNTH
jgi:hypothetical protein